MAVIKVIKPKLHIAQSEVVDNSSRFNVLQNGRRWGKSKLGIRLAMDTILSGGPVGYFVPSYEFSQDFWDEIKDRLESFIAVKNETHHFIKFKNKSELKIHSMEKARSGRGRKYKRVIIDEGAFAKNLEKSWTETIRATLADLEGDAWFLSTPNGSKNYFNTLYHNAGKKGFENWRSFNMPSSTNPYLKPSELEEIRLQLDELTYLQEYEAQTIDFNGKPFAYSFDEKKHVQQFSDPIKKYPIYLSFDFNVDPITCLVCQHNDDRTKIRIHKEYRLQHSDTKELCERILTDFDGHFMYVTGDASGTNTTTLQVNLHNYKIIERTLAIVREQIKAPKSNPRIRNSRVLTNSLLKRHPSLYIHSQCKYLIDDLKFVEMIDNDTINKTKDSRKTHLLDCLRYYFNTFHSDFIKYEA